MDAHEFLAKLAKIIKETGVTELSFTVADCGGHDYIVTDVPGVFVEETNDPDLDDRLTARNDEILIGGSENEYSLHYIGGENDLLKEGS